MWLYLLCSTGWATDWPVGPTQALTDLAGALAVAQPGDRVLIDPGTYPEDITITGATDLEIIGAGSATVFDGGSGNTLMNLVDLTDVTIRDLVLDGSGLRRPLAVGGTSTGVRLDNVTLRNGYGLGAGGAWVLDTATATFTGCRFEDNATANFYSGAGLRIEQDAAAVVTDCWFEGNDSGENGGGLWSEGPLDLSDSTFVDNRADLGGGAYCRLSPDCTVTDNLFSGGAAGRGGGMYAYDSVSTIVRNTFCNNLAVGGSQDAGGLMIGYGDAEVRNNVLMFERSVDDAGAMYVLDAVAAVRNNTFVANHADDLAGAARVYGASSVEWTNNLVTQTTAGGVPTTALLIAPTSTFTGGTNLYFDNQGVNVDPAPFASDVVGLDPLLTSMTLDCATASVLPGVGSPAEDAGSPAVLDPDGSISDIGATGGPDAVRDRDGDGVVDGLQPDQDCNDTNPLVFPGAPEVCNGLDDDCDGTTDVGATDAVLWYDDRDGDGYGATGSMQLSCDSPGASWITTPGDCDDTEATTFPGAVEVCGGGDEDCDGLVDTDDPDLDPTTLVDRYLDDDGDGYGTDLVQGCDAAPGTAAESGDCQPDDPDAFPGAPERCNDVDDDCDGSVDEDCTDPPTTVTSSGTGRSPSVVTATDAPAGCACSSGSPVPLVGPWLLLLLWSRRPQAVGRTNP